jgi:hypothetical protein
MWSQIPTGNAIIQYSTLASSEHSVHEYYQANKDLANVKTYYISV